MKKYIEPKLRTVTLDITNIIAGSPDPDPSSTNPFVGEGEFTNEDFGWDDEEDGANWKW